MRRRTIITNNWDVAIAFVLEQEGGYTLDPNDPGGETNFGISKKAFPTVDIKNLSVDQAKDIYRRYYWSACSCDDLPLPFAVALFDMAVNQGVGKAIKTLQGALGVVADGVVGPLTISAAIAQTDGRRVKLFLARRLAAYAQLMVGNPALLIYATNWSFRVVALAELLFKNGA